MMMPDVKDKYNSYPKQVQPVMLELRAFILSVASTNKLGSIEETLKWGEPAFLTKHGSTIRIDWKAKQPKSIFLYFNCKTILVETFKELYFDVFKFEGNRAIILNIYDPIPSTELNDCILKSFTYHQIKHLALLGSG